MHNFEISFTFQSIFKAAIQVKTFTFGHMREPALAATVSQSILKFSYEHFFVPHTTIHPDITKAIVTQEKLDLRHPVLAITVSFLHIIQHVVCFSGVPIQRLLQESKPVLNTPGGTDYKQRKSSQITKDHVVWGIRWDIQEEFTSLYVNFFHSIMLL
ncbi:hypothetical protein, partial [Thiolapillus sp.]|uniref:hypothetical protein n=1 Tax=Thiolapillus sp. TaxID=2017437 RepID=UPI003AF9AC95